MKRACALTALLLVLFSGCNLSSRDPVYFVMFEEAPRLFDSGVYFQGEKIGEIVARETGPSLAHKVTISVPDRHRDLIQTRTVFFVSAGQLQYAALAAYGEPLPLGSPVLGFTSKAAMIAFRVKNLMQPLPAAAGQDAARLFKAAG
ncbi:MAG: hypothetical protein PVG78_11765 [Desulfobacterales bacterium]|jgi:hypothetical protein